MADAERVENIKTAKELKQSGNALFKKGEFQEALKHYTKIFLYINHLTVPKADLDDQLKAQLAEIDELKAVGNTNCAQCFFKLNNIEKAKEFVDRALGVDSEYSKAIFLRGRIRLRENDFEGAEVDLKLALSANPEDKLIKQELELLKKKKKNMNKKIEQCMEACLVENLHSHQNENLMMMMTEKLN